MSQLKPIESADLKPYRPFGIALLKILFGVASLALLLTALYEYFL